MRTWLRYKKADKLVRLDIVINRDAAQPNHLFATEKEHGRGGASLS